MSSSSAAASTADPANNEDAPANRRRGPANAADAGPNGPSGRENGNRKTGSVATSPFATGAYEIISSSELMLKGPHVAHIMLRGLPITGSPHKFLVRPGLPFAAKS